MQKWVDLLIRDTETGCEAFQFSPFHYSIIHVLHHDGVLLSPLFVFECITVVT
jgi:hypothetical protein